MDPQIGTADDVAAEIAAEQEGLATREQLILAGVSATQIRTRVRRGNFHPEFRGVYRIGHRAPSLRSRYLAAVLACGEGSVLSGRAAAYLWGLIKGAPPPPEVTTCGKRRPTGVKVRRCRSLDAQDVGRRRAIPVTKVPRTLVDIAADLPEDELALACHEAGVKYKITPRQVKVALARRPNATGATKLRRVLSGDVKLLLSKLERRFIRLLREAGLPLPQTNCPAGGRYVDCRWPEHALTVELQSYAFHNSRHSWERDHRREREARLRGDDFRTFTWGDVFEHPGGMLRELSRELLG